MFDGQYLKDYEHGTEQIWSNVWTYVHVCLLFKNKNTTTNICRFTCMYYSYCAVKSSYSNVEYYVPRSNIEMLVISRRDCHISPPASAAQLDQWGRESLGAET